MKKTLRIVKNWKSYWIYDDIKLATVDAKKYWWHIHKIELNKFRFFVVNTPFISRIFQWKK